MGIMENMGKLWEISMVSTNFKETLNKYQVLNLTRNMIYIIHICSLSLIVRIDYSIPGLLDQCKSLNQEFEEKVGALIAANQQPDNKESSESTAMGTEHTFLTGEQEIT